MDALSLEIYLNVSALCYLHMRFFYLSVRDDGVAVDMSLKIY
jgi:hypothetical protein